MFNKSLDDIKELERLEDLEKAQEVQNYTVGALLIDDFLNVNMSLKTLNQLPSSPFPNETAIEGSRSS